MHAPIKYFEKGLSIAANGGWVVFNGLNKINQRPSFIPKWSEKPLLKSWQKVKPPLGWPRETDSLCPTCVREARQEQNGDQTVANHDQKKIAKTGKLKELKRGRFAAARANGMFGKDLQAAVFAIHQDAPGTLTSFGLLTCEIQGE